MTMTARARPVVQTGFLNHLERRTLNAACDALLPALTPEADDDPRLCALDAAALGVPAAIESAIAGLDQAQYIMFRQFLRALEQPALMRLLVGMARPFTALDPADRERALLALAIHPLPVLRTGFQSLKRLATFLFYSLLDEHGHNPAWPAIGYVPSPNARPRAAALRVTPIVAPTTIDCDVCVIGSGAGGGVVAAELAAIGKRVVVLEAGGGEQAPDFDQRELEGMQRLFLDQGMTATRDLGVAILAGATLGGGTTVNWQTSLRLPDAIRDEWADRSGVTHFREPGFTRSFEAVEQRLGIGTGESAINANNAALRDGCAALDYRWRVLPRNARNCDPDQCGYCMYGCRHGGKQSTAVTYLYDAQRADTTIIASCRADRVLIADGRVSGVEATATDRSTGRRHTVRVKAPLVVVAAGAIGSPALLMRSEVDLPALGRNLFLHPVSAVAGTYDRPIKPWRGAPMTILCDAFSDLSGQFGFRLETAPGHPGLLALATPWTGARQHRREMQKIARKSAILAIVRDRRGGRVSLSRSGRPLIEYQPSAEAQRHLRQGMATAARIHLAAGAREIMTPHAHPDTPQRPSAYTAAAIEALCDRLARCPVDRNHATIFSAHQMGTCGMGSDPRRSVCDENGAVWGVRGLFIADGSAFPAASGVNPMLTIMALAHHTAQRIKAQV